MMKRADEKRIAILIIILIGRTGLICSMLFLATLYWLGLPATATPIRLFSFGIAGLVLALTGDRLASGTWKGCAKVLQHSAAIAGVLFLSIWLRTQFYVNRPPTPPVWVIGISALAPISWWLWAPRKQRHSRKHLPS
jgi:hypothetical protein